MTAKRLLLAGATALLGCISSQAKGPNVVLILADDLGYGDIFALNPQSRIRTPNIDRLVKRGLYFTDAHSCSSVSSPSRYGLMTGRYAFRSTLKEGVLNGYGTVLGKADNDVASVDAACLISDDRRSIADMFQDAGYNTACIGKWHLGWRWTVAQDGRHVDFTRPVTDGPVEHGFDYYFGIAGSLDMPPYVYVENDMPVAVADSMYEGAKNFEYSRKGEMSSDFSFQNCLPLLTDKAIEYINGQRDEDSPFFLYFPLTAPHTPILPSRDFVGKSHLNPYGDFVMMVDAMVGMVVAALKKQDMWENTIFIFTSDNGCSPGSVTGWDDMLRQGHHPSYIYRGAKRDIWDGGHRIPCIISWGEHFRNQSDQTLVCLTDFYATFAQMTSTPLQANEAEDSYSFWSSLVSIGENQRKDIVHQSSDGSLALRKGRWKLIFCPGSGGNATKEERTTWPQMPQYQLYDMEKDPQEQHNLYGTHKKISRELASRLVHHINSGRSTPGSDSKNDPVDAWHQIESIYNFSRNKIENAQY